MVGAKPVTAVITSSFCQHRTFSFCSSFNALESSFSSSSSTRLFTNMTNGNSNNVVKKRTMKQATLFSAFGGAPAAKKAAIHAASSNLSSLSSAVREKDDMINPDKPSSAVYYTIFCDLDGVLVDFNAGVTRLLGKPPDQVPGRLLWPAIHRQSDFYRNLPWTPDGEALWEALRSSIIRTAREDKTTTSEESTTATTPTTSRNIAAVHILTGVSHGPGVSQQKYQWCLRELCVEVQHVNMAAPKRKHERVRVPPRNGLAEEPTRTIHNKKNEGVTKVITCWSKNKHCESGPGQ